MSYVNNNNETKDHTQVYLYQDFIKPAVNNNNKINKLISSITENELKDYTQVYLNYKFNLENIEITKEKIKNNTNKEIRKSYYKQETLKNMHYLFLFLIVVYIVFFIFACVVFYRKDDLNVAKKVGTLLVLFLLPILLTKLLLIILFIMQTFHKKIPKNINIEKIKSVEI